MKQILFSIVLPNYNRAEFLPSTIKSVQEQEYTNWELIIIDDGSKDNSKEIVEAFIKEDSRIKYFYQNNAERSVARNNGISKSKGDYICFLDSDDRFLSNHLSVLNNSILENKYAIAMFFTGFYSKQNNIVKEEKILALFSPFINYLIQYAVIPSRVCIHKDILKKIQFDKDITVVEDVILWTKIAFEYPVHQIEKPTVEYLLHDDNSINVKSNGAEKRLNGLYTFFKRYPNISVALPFKLKKRLINETLFNIVKHHVYHNRKRKAFLLLLKLIVVNPIDVQLRYKINILINIVLNMDKSKRLIIG